MDDFWSELNLSPGSGLLRAGVSAASGPAPDLTGLTPGSAVGSSGHINVSSGSGAVVGDVVWPFSVTAVVVGGVTAQ
jgi:hypothetical protein